MTIYIVGQIKIRDRAEYDLYQSKFMDVFSKFNGTLLSADFDPESLVGDWDKDRIVLMSFPSRDEAMAWAQSDDYAEIVPHRIAGADATVLLAKGFDEAE